MSSIQPNAGPPATAHISSFLDDKPIVRSINGFPGQYAIDLGRTSIHCTAEQWDRYDTAIRAGIKAAS